MIIGLAIALMIIFIWSIFTIGFLIDDGSESLIDINLKEDGLLITIAKLYWLVIGVIIIGGFLFAICYCLSIKIVCDITNNDYPQCVKENKNANEERNTREQ